MEFGGFFEFGRSFGGAQGLEFELTVDNWSSRLRIGAHGSKLELRVQNWSSWLRIGAHDSNLEHTVHVLELTVWICSSWLNG